MFHDKDDDSFTIRKCLVSSTRFVRRAHWKLAKYEVIQAILALGKLHLLRR